MSFIPTFFCEIRRFFSTGNFSPFSDGICTELMNIVEHRAQFAMRPVHFLANFLDPRLCGQDLTYEQEEEAKALLVNLAVAKGIAKEEILGELAAFQAKAGVFGSNLIWVSCKSCHPSVWWRGCCKRSPLSNIAASILEMPASTAPAERNWKSHKRQLTAKRNRLASDRLTKLVSVTDCLKVEQFAAVPKVKQYGVISLLDEVGSVTVNSSADEWILNAFGLEDEADSDMED